jgi:hypothetical protein
VLLAELGGGGQVVRSLRSYASCQQMLMAVMVVLHSLTAPAITGRGRLSVPLNTQPHTAAGQGVMQGGRQCLATCLQHECEDQTKPCCLWYPLPAHTHGSLASFMLV